jgi:hypothetical protein
MSFDSSVCQQMLKDLFHVAQLRDQEGTLGVRRPVRGITGVEADRQQKHLICICERKQANLNSLL